MLGEDLNLAGGMGKTEFPSQAPRDLCVLCGVFSQHSTPHRVRLEQRGGRRFLERGDDHVPL